MFPYDNSSKLRANLTMLTDFYEITMANGYFANGLAHRTAYFDAFLAHIFSKMLNGL